MSVENIQVLRDMGVPEQEAINALKLTNDDLSQAAEFLFGGSLPETETRASPSTTTNNIQTEGYANIEARIIDDIRMHNNRDFDKDLQSEHIEHISGQRLTKTQEEADSRVGIPSQQYNVFEDVTMYKNYNPHLPSVIIPLPSGYYENYISALVSSLYEIPEFRFKILSFQFKDFGFEEDWFKGNRLMIDSHVYKIEKNGKLHDMRFLLELQRLFIFLDNDKSSRFFTSVKQFIMNIPAKIFLEQENLNDIISEIFEWLTTELKVVEIDLDRLLKSTTKEFGSHIYQSHFSFAVDLDVLKHDIYQTFYEQLWDQKNNTSSMNYYQISDILSFTIQQENTSESVDLHSGIKLCERFYPGVFTEHYNPVFKELTHIQNKLKNSIAKREAHILSLKSYKGKRVNGFLGPAMEFFKSEGLEDLVDEIKSIQESVKQQEYSLREKINNYVEVAASRSPTDINSILNTAEELNLPPIDPYLLTSVIFSDIAFAYLKRDKVTDTEQWYYVEFSSPRIPGYKTFEVSETTFKDIRNHVKELTKASNLRESLIIVYTKECVFKQKVTSENYYPGILEFIELDEANLENQITSGLPDYQDSEEEEKEEEEEEIDLIDLDDNEEELSSSKESRKDNVQEKSTSQSNAPEPREFDFDEEDLEVCQHEE